jgi:hypothetical protein
MAGHAELGLLEPAVAVASEGTGHTPIESTGGVTILSDGNTASFHLNGVHSAATKSLSVMDAENSGVSVSSISFPSSQNEDIAPESVSVLIVFYSPFIPHIKSYTALTTQNSPKHTFLRNYFNYLDQNPLKLFLLNLLFLILMPTKPLKSIAVK